MIKQIPGIFNIGSKNGFSKDKFIKKVCKHKLFNNNLIKTKNSKNYFKIRRPKDMRMNVNKFERTYKLKLPDLDEEIIKL